MVLCCEQGDVAHPIGQILAALGGGRPPVHGVRLQPQLVRLDHLPAAQRAGVADDVDFTACATVKSGAWSAVWPRAQDASAAYGCIKLQYAVQFAQIKPT